MHKRMRLFQHFCWPQKGVTRYMSQNMVLLNHLVSGEKPKLGKICWHRCRLFLPISVMTGWS